MHKKTRMFLVKRQSNFCPDHPTSSSSLLSILICSCLICIIYFAIFQLYWWKISGAIFPAFWLLKWTYSAGNGFTLASFLGSNLANIENYGGNFVYVEFLSRSRATKKENFSATDQRICMSRLYVHQSGDTLCRWQLCIALTIGFHAWNQLKRKARACQTNNSRIKTVSSAARSDNAFFSDVFQKIC